MLFGMTLSSPGTSSAMIWPHGRSSSALGVTVAPSAGDAPATIVKPAATAMARLRLDVDISPSFPLSRTRRRTRLRWCPRAVWAAVCAVDMTNVWRSCGDPKRPFLKAVGAPASRGRMGATMEEEKINFSRAKGGRRTMSTVLVVEDEQDIRYLLRRLL